MTIKTLNHETAICASPSPEASPTQQRFAIDKCAELAALVDRYTDGKGDGAHATAIDPFTEDKTECREWHTDGWSGYKQVLMPGS